MQHQIKVVLVDDNSEFVDLLDTYLSFCGDIDVVGKANDGNKGVGIILDTEPDLVILDIFMPGISGLDILEKIRVSGMKYRPKIIMLTAVDDGEVIDTALTLGAEYFLIKPVDLSNLVQIIRQLCLQPA